MTLKEKFENNIIGVVGEEQIADDYAIEFGKWLNNQVININGRHHNLLGNTKVTQLLPIFKKEKGL